MVFKGERTIPLEDPSLSKKTESETQDLTLYNLTWQAELNPNSKVDKEFKEHLMGPHLNFTEDELNKAIDMFKIIITHEYKKLEKEGLEPDTISRELQYLPLILKGSLSSSKIYKDGFNNSREKIKEVKNGYRWFIYGYIAKDFSRNNNIINSNLESLAQDIYHEKHFGEKTIANEMPLLIKLREKATDQAKQSFNKIMKKNGYSFNSEKNIYEK